MSIEASQSGRVLQALRDFPFPDVLEQGQDGQIVLAGHRVTLQDVMCFYR